MARVLLLSAAREPYADPWHDFGATSARLAELLSSGGHEVELAEDLVDRLELLAAEAGSAGGVELLVADAAGHVPGGDESLRRRASAALSAYLAAGGPVLALHAAVSGLLGMPEWTERIGSRWLPEVSGHPPLGVATVQVLPSPLTGIGSEFAIEDELYGFLGMAEPVDVHLDHVWRGRRHPLVWTRETDGARAAGDALGHGSASYDSPEHRELILRLVDWLVEPAAP